MSFTVVSDTDLARSAARLRALSRRIERGDFTTESERQLAGSIGAALTQASDHIENARGLLPETGLDFYEDGDAR